MKYSRLPKSVALETIPLPHIEDENKETSRGNYVKLGIRFSIFIPVLCSALILLWPRTRNFFAMSGWRWAHIFSLAFTLSFCLNPLFAWLAYKYKILDSPGGRKLHQKVTPLLGGAAVFIGFLVALLFNGIFSPELGAILVSSIILFGVGLVDDFKEISAGVKLFAQLACTLLVIGSGIVLRIVPDDLGIAERVLNALLTVVWIIGITNAMNFFDGMDGLAAGLGALVSFFLGVVAFQTNQPFLGWISVAMIGGCLGFLPYNFKLKGDASIFLGDAGSTVIGFILACLAVYGKWAAGDPVVALISPILIFWIFIFDMVHITIDRVLNGRVLSFKQWLEYVGKDHLHHRLAYALGGKKKSVLFIYLMCLCLGTSAVVLRNARPVDAILLIIQAIIMVVLITVLERRGRISNEMTDEV